LESNLVLPKTRFLGGETVTGMYVATATDDVDVISVSATLTGVASARWSEQSGNRKTTFTGRVELIAKGIFFVPPKPNEAPSRLGRGASFEWPFAFQLPFNAPPSARFSRGAIVYELELLVRLRGMFTPNIKRVCEIVVLGSFDPELVRAGGRSIVASKTAVLLNGRSTLSVGVPRLVNVIDHETAMQLVVQLNNASQLKSSSVTASIRQHVTVSVKGYKRVEQNFCDGAAKGSLPNAEYEVSQTNFIVPPPSSARFLPDFDIDLFKCVHFLVISTDHCTLEVPITLVPLIREAALVLDADNNPPVPAQFFRPKWMPDDATQKCLACDVAFSLFKRRKHCRACGRVFCGMCCPEDRVPLPEIFGFGNGLEKVCVKCRHQPGGPAANAQLPIAQGQPERVASPPPPRPAVAQPQLPQMAVPPSVMPPSVAPPQMAVPPSVMAPSVAPPQMPQMAVPPAPRPMMPLPDQAPAVAAPPVSVAQNLYVAGGDAGANMI
jgi:hypothetical protein